LKNSRTPSNDRRHIALCNAVLLCLLHMSGCVRREKEGGDATFLHTQRQEQQSILRKGLILFCPPRQRPYGNL
jgi:hypothetical protein